MRVNPEDLVDQFVLAQVDVRNGNRRQERLEHASGADMVSREERPAAQTQVLADVGWVGVSHDTRRFSERLRVIGDSLRGTAGLPTGTPLHRTGHQRLDDLRSRVGVEFVQHAAHERTQLRRGHRLEGAIDVRIFRGNTKSPTATSNSDGIPRSHA